MSATDTRPAVDERLRFEGAWETKLVGDLGQTYGGLTGKSKDDFGHGEGRFVTFLNAIENVRLRARLLEPVDVAAGDRQNVVQPGDVIFNGTSETPGELAMGALVPDGFPASFLNSFCFGFRPRNDANLCSEFVAYFFRGRPGRRLLAALAQGATRYNLSKSQFRKLKLSLPGLPEQRAIAAALSDVDDLLQSLDRLIAKKRDVKQGAMQQLLTGNTRLPGPEGAWETKRLGEVVLLYSGHHVLAQYCNKTGQGMPYLTGPADFPGGRIRQTSFTTRPGATCRTGDLLITVKGSGAGQMCVADSSYCISRQLMAIRAEKCHPPFLQSLLAGHAAVLREAATGLIPGLSRNDLLGLTFSFPSLPEQRAIAAVLSDMDAEIDALEARRDKVAAIKQGMMQELLTGRTRLPIPEEAIDA